MTDWTCRRGSTPIGVDRGRSLSLAGVFSPLTLGFICSQGDRPHIHYKGFLQDGTEFDSSYARHTPISFPAGHEFVIKCWDDAVIGMCVGEEISLICPPEIAYGDRGAGGVIPPDATLRFEMRLVKIGEANVDA